MRTPAALLLLVVTAAPALAADTAPLIARIKAVGREGKGNDSASPAWKSLVSQGAPALFPTLTAIDDANPIASYDFGFYELVSLGTTSGWTATRTASSTATSAGWRT